MKVSWACFNTILIISAFTNAEKILQKKQWKQSLKGGYTGLVGEGSANTWDAQAGSANAYGGQAGSHYNYGGEADSPYTYGDGSWYGNADVTTGGWSGGNSGKGSTKGSSGKGGKSYGGGGGRGGSYVQLGNLGFFDGTTDQATCMSYNAGGTVGLDPCGSSFPNQWFVLEYSSMSPIQGSFMIRHAASGMYLMAPTTCAVGDLLTFGFRGQPGTDFFNEGNGLSLASVFCWAITSATTSRDLAVTWDEANEAVQMTVTSAAASIWMEVNQYFTAE